jgi:DNA-binding CsgD family transcriptional regulator/GAF domain-containing protein
MEKAVRKDIQNELHALRKRLAAFEALLADHNIGKNKDRLEIDLNSVVSDLTYSLITSNASLAGIADIVLNYAKVFTNSEYGYVSSIDPETGDNLCHTLTGMIGDSCRISQYEKGIIFPIAPDGRYPTLWGHCLNTRKAFFTNAPSTHRASAGTPDRHIQLNSFLSVPAIIGSDLYGQISLANSPGGYDDRDLKGVKRLAAVYALAIQREQNRTALEKEAARSSRLEEMIKIAQANAAVAAIPRKGATAEAASDMEEMNTALRVLLDERDSERQELEHKIVSNVDKLIKPYFEKLKQTPLNSKQCAFLEIIENNINDIISPFISNVTAMNVYLTPQEIQVASLVRSGSQTKEISALLGISINAVNFHRKNIRTKFNLKNEKINLRSFLLSLTRL